MATMLWVMCGLLSAAPADGPRQILSLDGEWDVRPIAGITFSYPPPADGWQKEAVPHQGSGFIKTDNAVWPKGLDSLLNKERTGLLRSEGIAAWFRRTFDAPATLPPGRRAILHFGGVAFRSEVWLNGNRLGSNILAQVPFAYDVTDVLREGANELLVGVTGREGVVDVERRIYTASTHKVTGGIWGGVELRIVSDMRLEDLFIRTSVREKRITVEATVINAGEATRTFTPEARITTRDGELETTLPGEPLTLGAGETRVITLQKQWVAPRLWDVFQPNLYRATFAISENGDVKDQVADTFGFREFEIRGHDFYLNGKRVVLRRMMIESNLGRTADKIDPVLDARRIEGYPPFPFNTIRSMPNKAILDYCDRNGLLHTLNLEFHTLADDRHLNQHEHWLDNVLPYYAKSIRQHRNHPSVVIWNLVNETMWAGTDELRMGIAKRVLETARAEDPTRPHMGDGDNYWDKQLPTINIHYPEWEVAPSLRASYPNSGLVLPNDMGWLEKGRVNTAWRARFEWDRPLVLGELWWRTGDINSWTSFGGDSIFDETKWNTSEYGPNDRTPEREWERALLMQADAYRLRGVAGLHPWSGKAADTMPEVLARPVDFFPNYFAGSTSTRRFAVINDSSRPLGALRLAAQLSIDGKSVWQNTIPLNLPEGSATEQPIEITFPSVSEQTQAILSVQLEQADGTRVFRHEERLFVMPRASLADLSADGIALLDHSGETASALRQLGLALAPLKTLTEAALNGVRVLIIGEGASSDELASLVTRFAESGGRVIVLHQEQGTPFSPELPEIDVKHVSSRAWKRSPNHPIVSGLLDAQLGHWRPDHLTSMQSLIKPNYGTSRVLLDTGGLYGMRWAGLVETPFGAGTFLHSQLKLVERVDVEPAAGQILARLVRYASAFEPMRTAPLNVLAGENAALTETLAESFVVTKDGVGEAGPVLVDATAELSGEDVSALKQRLFDGATVWLHGFTPDNIGTVAELFPYAPSLAPVKGKPVLRSTDPLVDNLGSFDLHWKSGEQSGFALTLPSAETGIPLTEPALMMKVPVGKGTILLDGINWEKELGAEGDKITRLASSLAANVGATVKLVVDTTVYDYFHIDLAPYANMGYVDRVMGDGKGGWTDHGPLNDMRFFLTNHVGRLGGDEDAVEDPSAPFPSSARFAGRPFALVNPADNDDKAVITLRAGDRLPEQPAEIRDIPIKRNADKLWFVHANAWTPRDVGIEVARYVIRYTDGTSDDFIIRTQYEIADWWDAKPLPRAKVAWSGHNRMRSPIGLYMTEWTNPHPDKTIASLDLIGDRSVALTMIVAITGGVAK